MRVSPETKTATRQRILDAAKKLFAQQGFEIATTRDIARMAQIATGTLFNYFPTKESLAECLIGEAHAKAIETFLDDWQAEAAASSLEESLFAFVAAGLRRLKPYRKYLPAALETSLSPLTAAKQNGEPSFRTAHLDVVGQIVAQHGRDDALSAVGLQLYWTLYTGALAFWAKDSSPRQEDTLALLDQSLRMFAAWLASPSNIRAIDRTGG